PSIPNRQADAGTLKLHLCLTIRRNLQRSENQVDKTRLCHCRFLFRPVEFSSPRADSMQVLQKYSGFAERPAAQHYRETSLGLTPNKTRCWSNTGGSTLLTRMSHT